MHLSNVIIYHSCPLRCQLLFFSGFKSGPILGACVLGFPSSNMFSPSPLTQWVCLNPIGIALGYLLKEACPRYFIASASLYYSTQSP